MPEKIRKYRCHMQTRPGMYTQYEGYVDVQSESDDWNDLFCAAVQKLKRTSFPDYGGSMWKMTRFESIN